MRMKGCRSYSNSIHRPPVGNTSHSLSVMDRRLWDDFMADACFHPRPANIFSLFVLDTPTEFRSHGLHLVFSDIRYEKSSVMFSTGGPGNRTSIFRGQCKVPTQPFRMRPEHLLQTDSELLEGLLMDGLCVWLATGDCGFIPCFLQRSR